MNGRKQVRKDGKECEEGFRDAKIEDHDPVKRAVDGHQGHGNRSMNEGKLESFEEHFFTMKGTKCPKRFGVKNSRSFATPSHFVEPIVGVNLHNTT